MWQVKKDGEFELSNEMWKVNWLVPLQSEDVFELGGITKEIVKQPVFAREGGCWFTRPWICFYNSFLEASKDMLIRSLEGKITPCF